MKKNYYVIIMLMFIANVSMSQTISRSEAWEIVKSNVLQNDLSNVNVYASSHLLSPNEVIPMLHGSMQAIDKVSWLFFIDDMPYQNWDHPCRYVFVGAKNNIVVLEKTCPPKDSFIEPISLKQVDTNAPKFTFPSKRTNTFSNEVDKRYAVIISGGGNKENNYVRYWNDCSAIYSVLINIYNYKKENIKVLMADGSDPAPDRNLYNGYYDSSPLDLDGDGLNDINYSATKTNVTNVLYDLSHKLTEDCDLFVFTTDHGYRNGNHSYMVMWNEEMMSDVEFANAMAGVKAKTISVVMSQCHSGGFIDDFEGTKNRVIATACRDYQLSFSQSNLNYNEFIYHWISAIGKRTPEGNVVNADYNNDGIVSMYEAFTYANEHDMKREDPQYASNPVDFGKLAALDNYFINRNIDEISIVTNDSIYYSINNLPPPASIIWEITNSNFVLEPESNTCSKIISKDYNLSTTLKAKLYYNNVLLKEFSKTLTSPSLKIRGEDYVSCCWECINKVNYLPLNATLNWNLPDILDIDFQKGDSVSVNIPKNTNLTSSWIEAIINVNGNQHVVRKTLYPYYFQRGDMLKISDNSNGKRFGYLVTTYGPDSMIMEGIGNYPFSYKWYIKVDPDPNDFEVMLDPLRSYIQTGGISSIFEGGILCKKSKPNLPHFGGDDNIDKPAILPFSINTVEPPIDPPIPVEPIELIPKETPWGMVFTFPNFAFKGTLYCEVVDDCGHSYTYSERIEYTPIHSISSSYNVVTNPASDKLTIQKTTTATNDEAKTTATNFNLVTRTTAKPLKIQLYNNYGIVRTINSDTSQYEIQMDISNLDNGYYYLNIYQEQQLIEQKKIIVQH